MGLIQDALRERNLPPILAPQDAAITADQWNKRRSELLALLGREAYGFSPPAPDTVAAEVLSDEPAAFAGKARHRKLSISFDTPKGRFAFPVDLVLPNAVQCAPVFLHIAFRPGIPDEYCPAEEIIDRGYGLASFCYNDVTRDAEDGFSSGIVPLYPEHRGADGWGKIGMWAWAASRVMDVLATLPEVDHSRVAVIGHSRLGKTALWCGACDPRFALAVSNDSGCSGAAISRCKQGESIARITTVFGYWFCRNYAKYGGAEDSAPFDQHFLLAARAPGAVYVSSAEDDLWADPVSEFLGCAAASRAYEALGLTGLQTPDCLPVPGTVLHSGRIGYHLRSGTHFLSRTDWNRFMDYFDKL